MTKKIKDLDIFNLQSFKELEKLGWYNVSKPWQNNDRSITLVNRRHVCPGTTYDQIKDTENSLTIKFPYLLKSFLLSNKSTNQKRVLFYKGKYDDLNFYEFIFKSIKDKFNIEYEYLCLQSKVDGYLEFKRQFDIRGYVYTKHTFPKPNEPSYRYVKAYETPTTDKLEWYKMKADKLYFSGRFITIVVKRENLIKVVLNDNILESNIEELLELFSIINIVADIDSLIESQVIEISLCIQKLIDQFKHFDNKTHNERLDVPHTLLNYSYIYNKKRCQNHIKELIKNIETRIIDILGESPSYILFLKIYPIFNRLNITLPDEYRYLLRMKDYRLFE
jgi:hypothetical protein